VEQGYMKEALVASNTERLAAIQSGEQKVVGVNVYEETEPSMLSTGEGSIQTVDEDAEKRQIERLNEWRRARNTDAVRKALEELERVAKDGGNIMPPSIAAAKAGVTTGEWGDTLRGVFGEFRAPTGVAARPAMPAVALDQVRKEVARVEKILGEPIKLLVAKPGLDGHSNGAEQIAVWATEGGIHVSYDGIRQTPEAIVEAAKNEKVHCVGLSVLSGSHVQLAEEVMHRLRDEGLTQIPVVLGGIIPDGDAGRLKQSGLRAIYTPRDYKIADILLDIVRLVEREAEAVKT
jgi:(2R)-ethylmalonyl-CoA mutase